MVATRVSLWSERWPAIALQECIDKVEAAPPDRRAEVKFRLPCQDCPKNAACLNAKAKSQGPLLYGREILTRPRSSESSLFPREMFEPFLDREMALIPYYQKPFGAESRYGVCSAWDIAWSEKTGGDWMVKTTGLVDRQTGIRTVIDILRVQRLSFSQQVDLIVSEWGKYHDDIVVLESDAAQMVWAQYVGEHSPVPVLRHAAGGRDGNASKRHLSMGVPGLIMEVTGGQWRWPYDRGTFHFENVEIFLSEAENFGWNDGKLEGVGEHDDTVMSWWHLSYGLKRLVAPPARQAHAGNQRGRYI